MRYDSGNFSCVEFFGFATRLRWKQVAEFFPPSMEIKSKVVGHDDDREWNRYPFSSIDPAAQLRAVEEWMQLRELQKQEDLSDDSAVAGES